MQRMLQVERAANIEALSVQRIEIWLEHHEYEVYLPFYLVLGFASQLGCEH